MSFWSSELVKWLLGLGGLLVALYPFARMYYDLKVLRALERIAASSELRAAREREDGGAADEECERRS